MKSLISLIISIIGLIIFSELIFYKIIVLKCTWPSIKLRHLDPYRTVADDANKLNNPVKIVILSDPKVANPTGSFFSSIHNWNMEKTYKALLFIHRPDIVFILGSLVDSDQSSNGDTYENQLNKIKKMFSLDDRGVLTKVVVSKKDASDALKAGRLRKTLYNSVLVENNRLFSYHGINFVLLNGLASSDANCPTCQKSIRELKEIGNLLDCHRGDVLESSLECEIDTRFTTKSKIHRNYDGDSEILKRGYYSRPIVIQHSPLYRDTKDLCYLNEADAIRRAKEGTTEYRPCTNCLSKAATDLILQEIKPRLVIAGESPCIRNISVSPTSLESTIEYSISSFSTQTSNDPFFLLMRATPSDFEINTCYTPSKLTIIFSYIFGLVVIIFYHFNLIDLIMKLVSGLKCRFRREISFHQL